MAFKAKERYRTNGPRFKTEGIFNIPHNKISDYNFICIISSGLSWQHVSISLRDNRNKKHPKKVKRCPTWDEMCFVKDIFWGEEDVVMQLHPKKSEYVSTHPYVLHLWRPTNKEIPTPKSILVGFPGDNNQKF